MSQAQAMASADITSQTAPLTAQVGELQRTGQQQQAALTQEFNQLMPYAQHAAEYTGQFNQMAESDAQAIYQQAGQQLNNLQQNSAAEAQRVAQQTGGPVSTGQFTSSLDPFATATAATGANNRLTSLELGVIGTDQANQFAGQVLPAMELEQRRTAQADINNKIQTLKDQIATIQGTKSKLTQSNYAKLQTAQQRYDLAKAQLQLKRQQGAQAWEATKRKLAQTDTELGIKAQHEGFTEYATTRALDQTGDKVTLSQEVAAFNQGLANKKLKISAADVAARIQHMSVQEKQAAQRIGISDAEYVLRQQHYAIMDQNATTRLQVQDQSNAMNFIDGLMGGKNSNKPVTVTTKKYLDPTDPLAVAAANYGQGLGGITGKKPPGNVYFDKSHGKNGAWYTYIKTTMNGNQFASTYGTHGTPITNPNAMYQTIHQAFPDMSGKMITNMLKAKLGLPGDWKLGDPASYTTPDLMNMSLSGLTDLARSFGFPVSPRTVGKQELIDFIHHHQSTRGQ
jgi:hypothetical protein